MAEALEVVELAGMTAYCDFVEQEVIDGEILVSAYDLHHKTLTGPFDFAEAIFIDSGADGVEPAGSGRFALQISSIAATTGIRVSTNVSVNDGNWHFLAATYDGAGQASTTAYRAPSRVVTRPGSSSSTRASGASPSTGKTRVARAGSKSRVTSGWTDVGRTGGISCTSRAMGRSGSAPVV